MCQKPQNEIINSLLLVNFVIADALSFLGKVMTKSFTFLSFFSFDGKNGA